MSLGAVVIVENIVRQLDARQHELRRMLTLEERTETVLAASKQVGSPMFFGVFISTFVYVPILALTGIEGTMFPPTAITVMLALTGALLIAFTLVPVLCSFLLTGRIKESESILIRAAKAVYRPLLLAALKLRYLVILAAILLLIESLWLFKTLGAEFTPKFDYRHALSSVPRVSPAHRTFLTLIVLPVLCLIFVREEQKKVAERHSS